jgi:zinc transport system substrate-binding protein
MNKIIYPCLAVLASLAVIITVLSVISPAGSDGSSPGRMGVAVSILPLSEFAERVGGDRVSVTVMVPPGASPHTYEPTPGQMVSLSDAGVYLKIGSGLEFELQWMDDMLEMNRNMLVVNCSSGLTFIQMGTGDNEGGVDPHVWLSPSNAVTMVRNVCNGFERADPENASYYRKNADDYITQLELLDTEISDALSVVDNRNLMVYHPSWGYFCRDYGLVQLPIEEDGKEPTAEGLAKLIDQAVANGIDVIFVSPEFSQASARTIADQVGAAVVLINPLSKDYIDNLQQVTIELT